MAGIKDYSTTASSNTEVGGVSIAEGMLPSNINNAFRAIAADIREWYNDTQWVIYGDGDGAFTAAYASSTSFTIAGVDVTGFYHAGRRIKAIGSSTGTIFGTISSSSFSTNTTVNVTFDSGSLQSETLTIHVAILSKTNDSIPTEIITNAKVASSAAIDATKIHDGTISNTEFGHLNGVSSNIQTQLDAKNVKANNLSDVASASTARTNLGLGTIATQAANNVAITGGSITGMSSPSSGSDVAIKTYVDDLVAGLKTRIICRAATTANVDLSADLQNGDTLDGITLATGNRVLVKDQSTGSQNGIYTVVASGTASRDTDFDAIGELAGQLAIVQEGSTNADKIFLCTTDSSASLGSSTITFSQVQPQFTGTVSSVGLADAGASEFTIANTPVTSSGNITIAVNSIAGSKITDAVVNDSSPQLGANLDTNSHNILIDDAHFIGDESGNEQIIFQTTASAVNELEVTNAATGNAPSIGASGETNVDLKILPKGTGEIVVGTGAADATITSNGSHNLILDTNKGTDSSSITIVDAANGDIEFTNNGTGKVKFNDAAYFPEATLTDASTISWDTQAAPVAKVTLGDNRTLGAGTNAVAGQFVSLLVIQDGTGSRTLSFNAVYEFTADTAPTLTTTANKGDLFVFRYNGSKFLEVGRNLNLTLS